MSTKQALEFVRSINNDEVQLQPHRRDLIYRYYGSSLTHISSSYCSSDYEIMSGKINEAEMGTSDAEGIDKSHSGAPI
jgi:endo-1,4-beta-mannosidase